MIDFEKLHRMEMQLARLADARRSRSDRYRERIEHSRHLRTDAVISAHPDIQTMPLNELLTISEAELQEGGVDVKVLRRAALERRLAEDERKAPAHEETEFAALSALVDKCRKYAGEEK